MQLNSLLTMVKSTKLGFRLLQSLLDFFFEPHHILCNAPVRNQKRGKVNQ